MNHFAPPQFWKHYNLLPLHIRNLADKNFQLLKINPKHPSLHFKQIDKLWSVRVGKQYRALGLDDPKGIIWFWIGTHADYDKLIS
jgi:hypothetical protein